MNAAPQCIGAPSQAELRPCAYCQALFEPKRHWGAFCSEKCRNHFEVDFGTTGHVASVRRINRGASIVIHLEGPAAERALKLGIKELVRVTRKP